LLLLLLLLLLVRTPAAFGAMPSIGWQSHVAASYGVCWQDVFGILPGSPWCYCCLQLLAAEGC
jgi:hypothetical protein